MSERRYGQWAGDEAGQRENPSKCVEEVFPTTGWIPRQCNRKRGYGPDGLYCQQHGKKAEQRAKYAKEYADV